MATMNLPDNPNTSTATVGKDYLLYVNIGTVAAPTWQVVGGQKGASLAMKADDIDVSNKASGGWSAKLAGLKSWSIDLDGLLLLNDAGIEALRQAFLQGKQLNVKLRYPDNTCQIGWASITDFSSETPHDGEASLKGTLNGLGPISGISKIISKAAAADVVAFFEGAAYATAVKMGVTAVDAASYDKTVAGQLTLESTYLGTLDVGEHIFYIDLSIGGQALAVVNLTA